MENTRTVVHIINGLGLGGSETMLYNMVRHLRANLGIKYEIITLGRGQHFLEPLQRLGVSVTELNITGRPVTSVRRLNRIVEHADVVCSWSYHTHLLTIWPRLRHRLRSLWFVRHANLSIRSNKTRTWLVMKM